MIFDTHAHYYDGAFDPDRDALLAALPVHGGGPGALPRLRSGVLPGRPSPWRKDSAIFTPPWASTRRTWRGPLWTELDQVRTMSAHPKVKAIGEIGLDYYWVKTPEARAFSRDFFDAQLSLAEELDLPAVVHDRDAHRDCLDIVRAHPGCPGGVPLLFGQRRGRQGTAGSGLDALLYREHHLCQCPAWPRGSKIYAHGPPDAGDRRPLYGPRALPWKAVRLHHDPPHRRAGGRVEGALRRGSAGHHAGERGAVLRYRLKGRIKYGNHLL